MRGGGRCGVATSEMEAVVVRRSACKATAEAVLCSAALPSSAARAREGAGEGESWRERVEMERAHAGELKARVCLPWPCWAEHRRCAAVAADTRRTNSADGRPLNGFIQFVSNEVPSLTMCFAIELTP